MQTTPTIPQYTLIATLGIGFCAGTHRIMQGLVLTKSAAIKLAKRWNADKDSGTTRYSVAPITSYCA